MKNILLAFVVLTGLFFALPGGQAAASADPAVPSETFVKAEVVEVLDSGEKREYGIVSPFQKVRIRILEGGESGKSVIIDHGREYLVDKNQLVSKGDFVVVAVATRSDGTLSYQISDAYRLNQITAFIVLFAVSIIILSGWKGLGAFLGMFFSLSVIVWFIIPRILGGSDPFLISIIGCLVIMTVTIFLAHGFTQQTFIAFISTFISLVLTGILAIAAVTFIHLSGLGNDDAYALKLGPTAIINLRGLLLGGILIGTLGVLDDVTTGLSAAIFELHKANPGYTYGKLLRSGLAIGREHISSLVNTLVLAYAGSSMAIFLTIVVNPAKVPLWVILNSELLMEEIVRTLVGSIGLISAVPITTSLASYWVMRRRSMQKDH